MSDYTLKVVVDAVADKFQGTIAKVKSSIQSLPDGLDGVTSKLDAVSQTTEKWGATLTKSVTVPLVGIGTVGVKKFAEVDQTMQLTNATMGNTADQAELLNKAMKDAAANSTFGMNDAATATLNFARAGLSAEQAASALAPAMNLAAGEGGNLDTVSAGLTATINGFGDTFDKASTYADVFANACNNSALDVNSLSNAMSVAAPIFSAAGYSVNDAALYMGVMANAGIEASVAANSLKTGMARLIEPSKQGAEWMEQLGLSMTDSNGKMKDTVTIQRELHDAFAGLSESEQIAAASAIFGKNQMSSWLALINTAPGDVEGLSTALTKEGTTADMASAMMSGFGGSIEKLKSSIDVATTSLGEALAPTILSVATAIQKAVDWFNELSPAQQQTVAKIALLVAAIGPLLLGISKITSGLSTVIAFGQKTGVLSKIFALPPQMLLIVGIIAAIVAAIIHLYNTNEQFRASMQAAWAQIQAAITPAVEALRVAWESIQPALTAVIDLIGSLLATVMPVIAEILSAVISLAAAILPVVTQIFTFVVQVIAAIIQQTTTAIQRITAIIQTIITIVKTVVAIIRGLWQVFGDWIGKLWDGIKTKISAIWDGIKAKIHTIVEAIKAIANSLPEPVKAVFTGIADHVTRVFDKIQSAWGKLKDFASGVANGISGAFGKMVSKVKSIINKFIGAANKGIGVVNSLPGVSISKIPYLAHGTKDWMGGFAVMNERGGELTYLPNGAQVIPHDVSMKYAKEAARYSGQDDSRFYSAMGGLANALITAQQMNHGGGGEYHITVELGGTRVAETVYRLNQEGELIMKGA